MCAGCTRHQRIGDFPLHRSEKPQILQNPYSGESVLSAVVNLTKLCQHIGLRESQYYQQWWIWLNSASILDFTLSSEALRKERYVLVTTPNCRVLAESTRSVYNELEMLVFKSTHNFAIHQISYMFRLSFCIHHQGDPKNCIITFHIL